MRIAWVGMVLWLFFGGTAVAATPGAPPARGPAVIPAAAGRPMTVPEPTYRWHGVTVPVGACGAVVSGRAMVLPCGDARVVAYRRQRAAQRAAATRRAADRWWWGGAGAAVVGVGLAGGVGLVLRRRRTRVQRGV